MGLEGRKVTDNLVMFGEPLNEKALSALKGRSPTANDIIQSLPKSAFINIDTKKAIIWLCVIEEAKIPIETKQEPSKKSPM